MLTSLMETGRAAYYQTTGGRRSGENGDSGANGSTDQGADYNLDLNYYQRNFIFILIYVSAIKNYF